MFREFVSSAAARQRYWARAVIGWQAVAAARPNPAHRALAEMEERGAIRGVITQNVDGLHRAAGSRRLVELHGALASVRCLDCNHTLDRAALQERLLARNPGWLDRATRTERSPRETEDRSYRMTPWAPPLAPDGDAVLDDVAGFAVEDCAACGGALKPDVVLFGENVPAQVVAAAWNLFDEAEALLVVGSSLAVFSGYRFVRRAAERGIPIAIVNRGPTRGDEHATLLVEARAGEALPVLAAQLR
jgi:NAD-dependent SIR2 family protein deacetylase